MEKSKEKLPFSTKGEKGLKLKKKLRSGVQSNFGISQEWKVLIVDDEEAIHTVTKLALDDFEFQEKKIMFISAYSAAEAKTILRENVDIALVLLDVVMETNHAGLDLVKFIREELNNPFIRIILRTGQPGEAPEKDVIHSYEINDYKTKTELTRDKLFTVVLASIRTFEAMATVESYRQHFEEKVQERTKELKQEIHERRQAEEKLRKLEKAIQTLEVGVTIIDTEGDIIYTNPAEAKMHGYTVDELIGKKVNIFGMKKDRRQMTYDDFKNAKDWNRERLNVRKDGSIFPVHLISSRIIDEDGSPIGMVTVCEDITQRKQAEEKLKQQNHELTELNREKSEVMGIVSHDLRNPLTTILGTAQLLKSYDFKPSEVRSFGEKIDFEGHRMLQLIINLLDINRIESGQLEISPEYFDLRFSISECVSRQVQAATEKGIKIRFDLPDDEYHVYLDKNKIEQILDNLISNAVKYTPWHKNVDVRLFRDDNAIRIEVEDEGLGLTKEDQKKLFGKFARLSAKPTGDEFSTGLGLSIVKKLTDMMGFQVWAESEGKNRGSKFTLRLA